MEKDELRTLLREFCELPLTLLEVEDGQTRVKMEKPAPTGGEPLPNATSVGFAAQDAVAAAGVAGTASGALPAEPAATSSIIEVSAPLVGTYYSSSAPDEAPYVEVGSHVEEGDVLCLIEAMKMINQIKAPAAGTVRRINCESGSAVGFGDLLMLIEADE